MRLMEDRVQMVDEAGTAQEELSALMPVTRPHTQQNMWKNNLRSSHYK